MNELVVEYLIVSKTPICDNIDSFKNLLNVNSKLSANEEKIKSEQIEVDYKIKVDKKEENNLFYLTLTYKEEKFEQNLESFLQLIKHIKTAIHLLKVEIYTLWDDISFYYSQKSYPLIHQVENLMRKLITKFMVSNVGVFWTKHSLPDDLKKEISNNQRRRGNTNDKESKTEIDTENILYRLDFIHLASLLLSPYQTEDVNNLYRKLDQAKNVKDLTLEELKKFTPKSNWQRYFSDLIQYEDSEFKKKWTRLYDLRCKIAHNNIVTKENYEEIYKLSSELIEKLKNAIENLSEIELSETEKEVILENVEYLSGEQTGEIGEKMTPGLIASSIARILFTGVLGEELSYPFILSSGLTEKLRSKLESKKQLGRPPQEDNDLAGNQENSSSDCLEDKFDGSDEENIDS